jgi:hypothetical protein
VKAHYMEFDTICDATQVCIYEFDFLLTRWDETSFCAWPNSHIIYVLYILSLE